MCLFDIQSIYFKECFDRKKWNCLVFMLEICLEDHSITTRFSNDF